MKRELQIKEAENCWMVTEKNDELFSIDKEKKRVSGEELFKLFSEKLDKEEMLEIELTKKDDEDKNDKQFQIVYDRLNDLLNKICDAINKVNHPNGACVVDSSINDV